MGKPSLNRPPRAKRPREFVRHVDDSMEALRRVLESGKAARPTPAAPSTTGRPER